MTAAATIADDLLAIVDEIDKQLALPRVTQLWLPQSRDVPPKSAEFGALVLDDGSVGLLYVLLGDTLKRIGTLRSPADLVGANPAELAHGFRASESAEKALGLGAINAISQHLLRASGCALDTETNSMASFEPGPGDRIGMVGFFPRLVAKLRAQNVDLTVIELKPELVQDAPRFRVTLDPAALQHCTRILCTSTILLNDSLDPILAHCRQAAHVAIIGPSAGYLPDPLFARGVQTVGGHQVVDTEAFLAHCEAEEKWSGSSRKYCLHRQSYPGYHALLKSAEKAAVR